MILKERTLKPKAEALCPESDNLSPPPGPIFTGTPGPGGWHLTQPTARQRLTTETNLPGRIVSAPLFSGQLMNLSRGAPFVVLAVGNRLG